MKDTELFSSNFDAFSDDLKISLSREEFNKEVVAAMKIALSTTVFYCSLNGPKIPGSSVGFLRLIINNCFKSMRYLVPQVKVISKTGIRYKLRITNTNKFLSLKFETNPKILEKIYTTANSEKITITSSKVPLTNIFATLTNKIIGVDMTRDQNTANLI